MSNNKHTPGPWKAMGRTGHGMLPHTAVAAKTLIARVYSEAFGDIENETANARLVAAAPDLLQALLALIPDAADAAGFNRKQGYIDIAAERWGRINAAKAAIAKATGDQS